MNLKYYMQTGVVALIAATAGVSCTIRGMTITV